MFQKNVLWHKFVALLLVMMLIIPILAACGGDEDETTAVPSPALTQAPVSETPTPTAISTATAAPKATTAGPVKIGAIAAWSGAMGISGTALGDPVIALVERQVKDMGGILGGRELKIIKCDNKSGVADTAACAKKLSLDDDISVLVFGGTWGAELEATSAIAEEEKILYISFGGIEGIPEKNFTVNCAIHQDEWGRSFLAVASKVLHAKTVGFLAQDMADNHRRVEQNVAAFKAAGIETIYEEYIAPGTKDFSPYLTKIKYKDPDVVVTELDSESYLAAGKQIMELGGWGDIKQIHMTQALGATKLPGIEGSYIATAWVPGLDYPGAKKFEQDYKALHGKAPTSNHVYFYLALWTAVNALELAGPDADRVAIAKASRSGKLEWESPGGFAGIETNGFSNLKLTVVRVEKGKLVPIDMPD